jgi:hypothetical protein
MVLDGLFESSRRGKKEHIVTVPCDPWKPEQGVRERPLRRKQTFKLPCDPKLLKSFEVRISW